MSRTSKTRYAVLGLLSLGPRSGYDIRKEVEETISHFWSESYGQIYPVLQRLVAEGLATLRVEAQEGKPSRKVYTLTDRGRQELRAWLRAPVEWRPARRELLLKLFFGREIPANDLRRHVEEYRSHAADLLAMYREIEEEMKADEGSDPNVPYALITLRAGLAITEAWVRWCDETLADLQRLAREESDEVHR